MSKRLGLEQKQVRLAIDAIKESSWREMKKVGDREIEILCFKGWANTEEEDAYGDTILASAWDNGLDQFKRNGPLLYMHDPCQQIGAVIELEVVPGKGLYVSRCEIPINPTTQHVVDMIEAGHMRGLSVGVLFLEYYAKDPKNPDMGYTVVRADLRELSVVSLPANFSSLIGEAKADAIAYMNRLAEGWSSRPQSSADVQEGLHVSQDPSTLNTDTSAGTQPTTEAQEVRPMQKRYLNLSEATVTVVKKGAVEVDMPTYAQRLYAHGPIEGEALDMAKKSEYALDLSDETGTTVDPKRVQLAMGLLFTRRSGVPAEHVGAAFERLSGMYQVLGLTVPDANPTQDVAFKDAGFKHDEAPQVSSHLLSNNIQATADGVTHMLKAGYPIEQSLSRQLAWAWIDIYKNGYVDDAQVGDLLEAIGKTPVIVAEDADNTPIQLRNEEAPQGLDLTGIDPEVVEALKAAGIDPTAPDASEKLAALTLELESSISATKTQEV